MADWNVPADIGSFREALEWFQSKLPMPKKEWDRLNAETRQKAFTVAQVASARIISDVQNDLSKALESGKSFQEIKEDLKTKLDKAWGGSVANPGHRIETIIRTNVQSAYSAGRERLANHPVVRRTRPYARFDALSDDRTSDLCASLNGVIKPIDDPWWDSHTPPLHFNCRSGKVTLSEEQAQAEGITTDTPKGDAQAGFGSTSPGKWTPEQGDMPDELWDRLQQRLAAGPGGGGGGQTPPSGPPPPPSGGGGDDGDDEDRKRRREVGKQVTEFNRDRHDARKTGKRSRAKRRNSIVRDGVPYREDLEEIRKGNGEWSRDPESGDLTVSVNGRRYGLKPPDAKGRRVPYPIDGEGVVPLTRPQMRAAIIYGRLGFTEAAERELDDAGYSPQDRAAARLALTPWKPPEDS